MLLLALFAGSLTAQTPTKYFVSWNTGNDQTGDGLTWQTAFKTVGKACVTIGLGTNDGRTYTLSLIHISSIFYYNLSILNTQSPIFPLGGIKGAYCTLTL